MQRGPVSSLALALLLSACGSAPTEAPEAAAPFNFWLGDKLSAPLMAGGSSDLSVRHANGWDWLSDPADVEFTEVPVGLTVDPMKFRVEPQTRSSSTVRVSAAANVTPGRYTLTATGTQGSVKVSDSVTFDVYAAAQPLPPAPPPVVPPPNHPAFPHGYQPPCVSPWLIKGNLSSSGERIYHLPGGAYYNRTIPEVCFITEADARADGFRRSSR